MSRTVVAVPGTMRTPPSTFSQAFGVIAALRAGDATGAAAPVAFLEGLQNAAGAWPSFIPSTGDSDVDSTAIAAMALALLPGDANATAAVTKALAWIASRQSPTGGFPGVDVDSTNSSALAIQALTLGGPQYAAEIAKATAFLAARQNADGGFDISATGQPGSDARASAQAVERDRRHLLRHPLRRAAARHREHDHDVGARVDDDDRRRHGRGVGADDRRLRPDVDHAAARSSGGGRPGHAARDGRRLRPVARVGRDPVRAGHGRDVRRASARVSSARRIGRRAQFGSSVSIRARLGAALLASGVALLLVPIAAPATSADPIGNCTTTAGTIIAVDFAHWGGPVVRGCGVSALEWLHVAAHGRIQHGRRRARRPGLHLSHRQPGVRGGHAVPDTRAGCVHRHAAFDRVLVVLVRAGRPEHLELQPRRRARRTPAAR